MAYATFIIKSRLSRRYFFENVIVPLSLCKVEVYLNTFLLKLFMELTDIKFLAKGHRSTVYTARYNGKIVAVKERRSDIDVSQHILNEGRILKILNKHRIGPKPYYYDKDKLVMEYVNGSRILDWIEKNKSKAKIRKVIIDLLKQCIIMYKLGIEKMEMHKPVKHVIIGKRITLIDFERARKRKHPRNVTQLCQFFFRIKVMKRDVDILKRYKKNQTDKNFISLKKLLLL